MSDLEHIVKKHLGGFKNNGFDSAKEAVDLTADVYAAIRHLASYIITCHVQTSDNPSEQTIGDIEDIILQQINLASESARERNRIYDPIKRKAKNEP